MPLSPWDMDAAMPHDDASNSSRTQVRFMPPRAWQCRRLACARQA